MRIRNSLTTILALIFCVGCMSGDVEEGDHELLLKVEDLAEYGLELPRGYKAFESMSKESWFDGSVMIEYEFYNPDNPDLPFIYSMAEVHRTRSDASVSYSTGNFAAPLGLGDAEMVDRDNKFSYGDNSRNAWLLYNGQQYGNYFAMHDGRTVFTVITSGFYFDDDELWKELLEPTLTAVSERNKR